jgi:hypothetical protein
LQYIVHNKIYCCPKIMQFNVLMAAIQYIDGFGYCN